MLFANTELGSLAIREREADPEDFESRLKSLSSVTKGQPRKHPFQQLNAVRDVHMIVD